MTIEMLTDYLKENHLKDEFIFKKPKVDNINFLEVTDEEVEVI